MSRKFFLDGKSRTTFDVFKSNICHRVKDSGDIPFIIEVLQSNVISDYFEKKWYAESLYLLAMLDYISKENNVPLCTNYDRLRQCKLPEIVYPQGIIILASVTKNEQIKVDKLRSRFGFDSIIRAVVMQDLTFSKLNAKEDHTIHPYNYF